jgi:RND family efflux transporter MFP subunit
MLSEHNFGVIMAVQISKWSIYMQRNRIFLLMIAILVASSLIGCTGATGGNGSTPTASPTLVLQDTIVSAQGEVTPEKWASLAFTSGGSDLNIRVSVGNSVKSGELLASVNDVAQQAAVSNANAALSSAQANLKRLQDLKASDSDISVAQKAVDAAQASLDQAQESLDETELKAPFDGVIVDIFLRDFEIAPPDQPVILLADLTSLVVETTDLGEVDVARVQINDPATVVFDALPDVTATGRVTRTALHPEAGAGTYFTVTIKLDEIPENLHWGMSAFVEIKVSK